MSERKQHSDWCSKLCWRFWFELNHGCLLGRVRRYRNEMPRSDITFLVVFFITNMQQYRASAVCSCGLTEPDCQQWRPWTLKHGDVCSMHCVSIVAGCVDSLWAFRKCLRRRSLVWNQPRGHLERLNLCDHLLRLHASGADLGWVRRWAYDNGEVLRVGWSGGQRV